MKRLLLVGCGDIALRVADKLKKKYLLFGLIRSLKHLKDLRSRGIVPVIGDLDNLNSLKKISGISDDILHFAPPSPLGLIDRRTINLLHTIKSSGILPQRLIYISTSGVYGDAKGKWVSETDSPNPSTDRGIRRLNAENLIRKFGRDSGVSVSVLRVPGIYSKDRLPLTRLKTKMPLIRDEDDSFSNHVHVADLVRIVIAALRKGKSGRIYNVCDNSTLKVGDYFDIIAKGYGFEKPRRLKWQDAKIEIPPSIFSFMRESRRINNARLKSELIENFYYSSVSDGIFY